MIGNKNRLGSARRDALPRDFLGLRPHLNPGLPAYMLHLFATHLPPLTPQHDRYVDSQSENSDNGAPTARSRVVGAPLTRRRQAGAISVNRMWQTQIAT